MKRKPVSKEFAGTFLGSLLRSRAGVIISNWIFQGMRSMNIYEISFKLILDILFTAIILLLESQWLLFTPMTVVLAVLSAHTLNWFMNGHFYVLCRYIRPMRQKREDFENYVQGLFRRATHRTYLDGIAIFGSYCRGKLHEHSDLDVRFLVRRGFINGTVGAIYCFSERFLALFKKFPLDIYCCVETDGLGKLREDETPVILMDRSGLLGMRYPGSIMKFEEITHEKR